MPSRGFYDLSDPYILALQLKRLWDKVDQMSPGLEALSKREYDRSKMLGELVIDLQKRVSELERKLNA